MDTGSSSLWDLPSLVMAALFGVGYYFMFRWAGHRPNLFRILKLLIVVCAPIVILLSAGLRIAEEGGNPKWLLLGVIVWPTFLAMVASIRWGMEVLQPPYRRRGMFFVIMGFTTFWLSWGLLLLFGPGWAEWSIIVPMAFFVPLARMLDKVATAIACGGSHFESRQGTRIVDLIGLLDSTDWEQLASEHARLTSAGERSHVPEFGIRFQQSIGIIISDPMCHPYRGRCTYRIREGKLWGYIPNWKTCIVEFEGLSRESLDEAVRLWKPSDPAWVELLMTRCTVTRSEEVTGRAQESGVPGR